jgi:TPR repeat protein
VPNEIIEEEAMKHVSAAVLLGCLGVFLTVGQEKDLATAAAAYDKHDYATAFTIWEPLAESGSAPAQFNLALLFYDGRGVPQDFERAAKWFERAAGQGYTNAQRNLGELYFTGKGVKRDYVQSYKWFNLCAASGNETCADHRDVVAKKLSASKLAEAQRLAREWKPKVNPVP